MMRIHTFAVILALTLLAACARPAVTGLTALPEGLDVQNIFVATQRGAGQMGSMFGARRNTKVNYGQISISIPPGHQQGQLERGKGVVDPAKFFAPVAAENYADVAAFARALQREQVPGGDVLVYVHGYNNTLEDAAFRLAQIRHDFGLTDPAVLFAWPSAGDARGYIYDRDSVLFARDGFEDLIRELRAHGQRRIFILAHSMGGYLTMESLRQMALKGDRHMMDAISAVVLMSPDIDPDAFRHQAEAIGKLPQPFLIMTSRKDRVLTFAELLTGRKPRLGRIEDQQAVAGLNVTVVDLTNFDDGSAGGHMVAASSSSAIQLLKGMDEQIRQGRTGQLRDFVLLGKDQREGLLLAQ